MTIFILLILALVGFVGHRIYIYKKQREVEEMASDAQAYVSSEIVELLQHIKTIKSESIEIQAEVNLTQQQVQNLMENMVCHTDSESSVREYLSAARQDIALLKVKLEKLAKGEILNTPTSDAQPISNNPFDALK